MEEHNTRLIDRRASYREPTLVDRQKLTKSLLSRANHQRWLVKCPAGCLKAWTAMKHGCFSVTTNEEQHSSSTYLSLSK